MEYIAGSTDFKLHNSAVTLGKFDGLHLGHQLLIDKVVSFKDQGYKAVMFSFLLHPGNLFSDKEFELIYTEEEKIRKLRDTGIDSLVSYPFTQETRNIEAEDFIKDILVDKLDAKIIVVGDDFRFGHNRRGDFRLLKSLEKVYGYQVIECERIKWKDTTISSSVIRNELKEGRMEVANEMLGQNYSILGKVLHGRKIGRTLGVPTINMTPSSNKLLPASGVYASKTIVDGTGYLGVTNVGYKPTVGTEDKKGVETFLFDFDQDLYGKEIEVKLYTFLRPEYKYATLDALKDQMQLDVIKTREYFQSQGML